MYDIESKVRNHRSLMSEIKTVKIKKSKDSRARNRSILVYGVKKYLI
jgi:hypothetical protein